APGPRPCGAGRRPHPDGADALPFRPEVRPAIGRNISASRALASCLSAAAGGERTLSSADTSDEGFQDSLARATDLEALLAGLRSEFAQDSGSASSFWDRGAG
ncbi:unnamed protein product, partial [Polarella glacialis]